VATPQEARVSGADYIIVGRPITKSNDPLKTYKQYVKLFTGGQNE
jgi:orotidine-5'-phosphate decarboxylase